jgi:hypothetical protein
MTDNTEEDHLDNPAKTQPDNPSDNIIPTQSTETIEPKQEIQNMEVHHHPQVEKKNFKEYLLEGLMIFVAVMLGFFAENLREHISDNEKGEQYIQSLTEDLEADTTRMNDIIRYDEEKTAALSSMYQCYDTVSNNLKATSCMGVLVKYSKVNRPFQLNDRTIMQLANAGGYRLLKKEDADSILAYERSYKSYHDFESTAYQEAQNNVRNTLNELGDFRVIAPLQNVSALSGGDKGSSTLEGSLLFSEDRALLNKWFNQLQLYLRVTKAQILLLNQLKAEGVNLIAFYKNKHHLE